MRFASLCFLVASASVALAQTPSLHQETQGPCSVALSGSNNQVFTCQGFDDKTAKQILAIVNRIAAKQLDPALVMEKLDEIQKSLGDIKQASAARHITPEQRRLMLPLLKAEAPQELYFVCSPDPESQAYFGEISNLLNEAGWKFVPHPPNWGTVELYPPGVEILVADGKNVPRGAMVLQNIFKKAEIDANGADFVMMLPAKLALYVGPKPPASQ